MAVSTERVILSAIGQLNRSERAIRTLDDAVKSIRSLIATCDYLIEIVEAQHLKIEEQDRRIENLEDALEVAL